MAISDWLTITIITGGLMLYCQFEIPHEKHLFNFLFCACVLLYAFQSD